MHNILIADSGSTKTDWCVINGSGTILRTETEGINPIVQNEADIAAILQQVKSQSEDLDPPSRLYFYGSGIRTGMIEPMKALLSRHLQVEPVVQSDLVGAAKALCGRNEGMACILGTGSNSCLYDGTKIIANTPSLGYILGDEGGGAALGKRFLNAILKRRLPANLIKDYEAEFGYSVDEIIRRIYREAMPNRFMASFSPFIHRHLDCKPLHDMVVDNFKSFFSLNLTPYERKDLPVNAVGSMAFFYRQALEEAAEAEGYRLGLVVKSPMEGLIDYHAAGNDETNSR